MGNNSLISMGLFSFRVLELMKKHKTITEINEIFYAERQAEAQEDKKKVRAYVQNTKADLIASGWVVELKERFIVTPSGEYFFKTIYSNPIIKEKLK